MADAIIPTPSPTIADTPWYLTWYENWLAELQYKANCGDYAVLEATNPGVLSLHDRMNTWLSRARDREALRDDLQRSINIDLTAQTDFVEGKKKEFQAQGIPEAEWIRRLSEDQRYQELHAVIQQKIPLVARSQYEVDVTLRQMDRLEKAWEGIESGKADIPAVMAEVDVENAPIVTSEERVREISAKYFGEGATSANETTSAEGSEHDQGEEAFADIDPHEFQEMSEEEQDALLGSRYHVHVDHLQSVRALLLQRAATTPRAAGVPPSGAPGAPGAGSTGNAGLGTPGTPGAGPQGAPPSPTAPGGRVERDPVLYENALAHKIEKQATQLGATFATAMVGEDYSRKAIEALGRDPAAFMTELMSVNLGVAADLSLQARRDQLMAATHPFSKGRLGASGTVGPGPLIMPVGSWTGFQQARDNPKDTFLQYQGELRELARLTTLADAARGVQNKETNRILTHIAALDKKNPESWGTTTLKPGIFKTWQDVRLFAKSCERTLEYADVRAPQVAEGQKERILVTSSGMQEASFAAAYRIFDGMVSGRASQADLETLDKQFQSFVGHNHGQPGTIGGEITYNESAVAAHEVLAGVRSIAANDVNWDRLRQLSARLSSPASDAHFTRSVMQDRTAENMYLPAERDALTLLGSEKFKAAYQLLNGNERQALWQQVRDHTANARSGQNAMGVFLACAHNSYHANRLLSGKEIGEATGEYVQSLRINHVQANERITAWAAEMDNRTARRRQQVIDVSKGAADHSSNATKTLLGGDHKASGFENLQI